MTVDPRAVYGRVAGVVWRAVDDRVLLHRLGVPAERAAIELSGRVAFVWVALDEPGTIDAIVERLADAGISLGAPHPSTGGGGSVVDDVAQVVDDVAQLVDVGVIGPVGGEAVPTPDLRPPGAVTP